MLVSSPILGPWPDLQYQTRISSCGTGFKFKQKVVGYSCSIHSTAKLLGTSCQAGHDCSSQGSQLGKTVDDSSFHTGHIAHSVLWKLANMEEASWSVPTRFLHVLWRKLAVSSMDLSKVCDANSYSRTQFKRICCIMMQHGGRNVRCPVTLYPLSRSRGRE